MSQEKRVAVDISPTYIQSHENGRLSNDALGQYIHDTKKYPVLPAEEIARLSRLVQDGIAASAELAKLEDNENQQRREELEEMIAAGNNARNEVINANTGLVFHHANQHTVKSVEYLDLIQAGNLGLIRAVEKFDPDQGHAFSTYAKWWIRSFISQEIHWTSRAIRIPEHVAAQMHKLRKITQEHAMMTGEEMTIDEMTNAMGKDKEEILDLLNLEKEMTSLDKSLDQENDVSLETIVYDKDALSIDEIVTDSVVEQSIINEVRSLLAISTLDDRSKQIIQMQFGIGHDAPMTPYEIHKRVVGRPETITMLAKGALEHLRAEAELFGLDRLLDADSE